MREPRPAALPPLRVAAVEPADRRRRRDHVRRAARELARGVRLRGRPVAHPAPADRRARGAPLLLHLRAGRRRRRGSACARSPAAPSRVAGPRGAARRRGRGAAADRLVHARPGTRPAQHVLIAAGSGITPMLSIAASVLADDRDSTVTLLYGNRRTDTVMFADELADLKDAQPGPAASSCTCCPASRARPSCSPAGSTPTGCARCCRRWSTSPTSTTGGCAARSAWSPTPARCSAELGVPRERVHHELFYVDDAARRAPRHDERRRGARAATVTVVLDGRTHRPSPLPRDRTVLDGAQRVRPDLPFACKGGVCGTCRARVTDGEVDMRRNFALEPRRGRRRLRADLPDATPSPTSSPSTTTPDALSTPLPGDHFVRSPGSGSGGWLLQLLIGPGRSSGAEDFVSLVPGRRRGRGDDRRAVVAGDGVRQLPRRQPRAGGAAAVVAAQVGHA